MRTALSGEFPPAGTNVGGLSIGPNPERQAVRAGEVYVYPVQRGGNRQAAASLPRHRGQIYPDQIRGP